MGRERTLHTDALTMKCLIGDLQRTEATCRLYLQFGKDKELRKVAKRIQKNAKQNASLLEYLLHPEKYQEEVLKLPMRVTRITRDICA